MESIEFDDAIIIISIIKFNDMNKKWKENIIKH